MKTERMVLLVMVIGLIFVFSSQALGNGTDPPDGTSSNVDIDKRPIFEGNFKARKYKIGNEYKCEVIVELKLIRSNGFITKGKVVIDLGQPISDKLICTYTSNELEKIFKKKIGADQILPKFGMPGTKLTLKNMIIKSTEYCDNFELATINGWILIRVDP